MTTRSSRWAVAAGGTRESTTISEADGGFEDPEGVEAERAADAANERAEAAESRLRSKIQFLAEAEHKLKTAMSVITGWSVTLQRHWSEMSDEQRLDAIDIIRQRSESVRSDAERMLQGATAEMMLLDSELECMDLREVLRASIGELRGVSDEHRISLEACVPVTAWISPAGFQQVLGHLIENAVKYSPEGGTITLRLRRKGPWAIIEVSDEGTGIPDGVDVFAPFQQGANGTGGVGLGLYIVHGLVLAMQGSVEARRNEGPGSTFTVRLRSGLGPATP
jgi:signal transduction histidine kinase